MQAHASLIILTRRTTRRWAVIKLRRPRTKSQPLTRKLSSELLQLKGRSRPVVAEMTMTSFPTGAPATLELLQLRLLILKSLWLLPRNLRSLRASKGANLVATGRSQPEVEVVVAVATSRTTSLRRSKSRRSPRLCAMEPTLSYSTEQKRRR